MKMMINRYVYLFASVFLFVGCQAHVLSYQGAKVTRPKDIISLPGQSSVQGSWKTDELSVHYTWQTSGETLTMTGTVALVGGFAVGFNVIDRLAVQVLFVDGDGTVLADNVLYSVQTVTAANMVPLRFNRTFPVPAGTTGIAFAYDGELSDGGGGGIGPGGGGLGNRTHVTIGYFPSS